MKFYYKYTSPGLRHRCIIIIIIIIIIDFNDITKSFILTGSQQ